MSTFSERLRKLRQAANLSQVQLAGEDLSPSYISLLESGKRQPSDDVAALLAERLGCPVEDLLTPAGEERRKQAELNLEMARLSLRDGDHADARIRLDALLAEDGLDRSLRDEATLELARAHVGLLALDEAIAAVLPLYERALAGGSHLPVATVASRLGRLYNDAGDLSAAVRVGEQAVRTLQDRRETGTREYFRLVATLASAYHDIGDVNHARAYLADAMQVAQRFADPHGEAALAWNGALAAESIGRLDEALHLSRKALAIFAEHPGSARDQVALRSTSAYLIMRQDPGRVAEARHVLEQAAEFLPQVGAIDVAIWQSNLALVTLVEGDAVEAERLAREALVTFAAYPDSAQAETHLVLGDALAAQGRIEEALERFTVVVDVLQGLRPSRETAGLWRDVSDRFVRHGRLYEAIDGYRSALDAVRVRSTGTDVAIAMETARQQAAAMDELFPQDEHAEDGTPAGEA